MTQQFQLIGGVSPDLEAVARQRQGWQLQRPVPLGRQTVDATDYSFYAKQANDHALGLAGASSAAAAPYLAMAGRQETPMAGLQPHPANEFGLNPPPLTS